LYFTNGDPTARPGHDLEQGRTVDAMAFGQGDALDQELGGTGDHQVETQLDDSSRLAVTGQVDVGPDVAKN